MTWKVIGHDVKVNGKLYRHGEIILSDERPTLDDILDERHWETMIEQVSASRSKAQPPRITKEK